MDTEKIWKTSEWTNEARQIIDGLKKFPNNSKIILILRHSHRSETTILQGSQKVRLTPQGHAIAKKFGENLPINRPITIFHSIIWRCEETAKDIQEGFISIGGESELKGELLPLVNIGIKTKEFYIKVFNNGNTFDSFYRWAVGYYDPNDWTPFYEYCRSAAHLFLDQVKNAPENGLNIFVTHDFNLLAFRYGWFGLPIKKWVKFLGGFAYTVGDEQTLLLDYGKLKTLTVPHWWKNP